MLTVFIDHFSLALSQQCSGQGVVPNLSCMSSFGMGSEGADLSKSVDHARYHLPIIPEPRHPTLKATTHRVDSAARILLHHLLRAIRNCINGASRKNHHSRRACNLLGAHGDVTLIAGQQVLQTPFAGQLSPALFHEDRSGRILPGFEVQSHRRLAWSERYGNHRLFGIWQWHPSFDCSLGRPR